MNNEQVTAMMLEQDAKLKKLENRAGKMRDDLGKLMTDIMVLRDERIGATVGLFGNGPTETG